MDFVRIKTRSMKNVILVYPDFKVDYKNTDLMVAGGKFYAVWDSANNVWSTNEGDVSYIVDNALDEYSTKMNVDGASVSINYMNSFDSGSWKKYKNYMYTPS